MKLVRIELAVGTPILSLDECSVLCGNECEREILLPRGMSVQLVEGAGTTFDDSTQCKRWVDAKAKWITAALSPHTVQPVMTPTEPVAVIKARLLRKCYTPRFMKQIGDKLAEFIEYFDYSDESSHQFHQWLAPGFTQMMDRKHFELTLYAWAMVTPGLDGVDEMSFRYEDFLNLITAHAIHKLQAHRDIRQDVKDYAKQMFSPEAIGKLSASLLHLQVLSVDLRSIPDFPRHVDSQCLSYLPEGFGNDGSCTILQPQPPRWMCG